MTWRVDGEATSCVQRSRAAGSDAGSTIREKWPPTSSAGLKPVTVSIVSDRKVNTPWSSVEKTMSGEFSTRNR